MSRKREQEIEESLEFLRQRFDDVNSNIKLPHSLSADMLRYKLENLDLQTEVPRKNIRWKPIMGVAACFVVGVVSIFTFNAGGGSSIEQTVSSTSSIESAAAAADAPSVDQKTAGQQSEAGAEVDMGADIYAESYTGIRDMIFDMNGGVEAYADVSGNNGVVIYSGEDKLATVPEVDDAAFSAPVPPSPDEPMAKATPVPAPQTADVPVEESAPAAGAATEESAPVPKPQEANAPEEESTPVTDGGMAVKGRTAMPASFALTGENGAEYVNGMLEVSGEYIYSYAEESGKPHMYISKAGDKSPSSEIALTSVISSFYVSGNRLVTVGDGKAIPKEDMPGDTIVGATDDSLYNKLGAKKSMASGGYSMNIAVEATLYDVSDKTQPKLVKTFMQDGSYTDSCIRDDVFYLVTSRPIWPTFDGKDAPMSELVPVTLDSSEGKASLLPAKSIAMAQGSRMSSYAVITAMELSVGDTDTQAVLGGGDGVHLSDDDIYVYYNVGTGSAVSGYEDTGIIRLGMDGKKLSIAGQGKIPGSVAGSSAFGENVGSDGTLMIVSTVNNPNGGSETEVTVFDDNFNKLGSLDNIAKNEYVSTVHYAGDTAYLVTVGDTAPVFVVDLSAPASPKLLGRIEIEGAQDVMKAVDDSTVVGLSRAFDTNGMTTGINISLLDITEPMNPRVLYSEKISGAGIDSDIFMDKSELLFDGKSTIAFPVTRRGSSGVCKTEYAAYSFSRNEGIKTLGKADDTCAGDFADGTLYLQTPAGVTAYGFTSALAPKNETLFKA